MNKSIFWRNEKIFILYLLVFISSCSITNERPNNSITNKDDSKDNDTIPSSRIESVENSLYYDSILAILYEDLDTAFLKQPIVNYLTDGEYVYDVIDTFSNFQERDAALRKCIFKKYNNLLKSNLDSNKIPLFMYDECLDSYKIRYCFINSERMQSLRHDLINNLSDQLIDKLLLYGNTEKMNRRCLDELSSILPYGKNSNLELIEIINFRRNKN